MFMKTLQMMSKKDLIHQIMIQKDRQKMIRLMKIELGGIIMTGCLGIRPKTHSYLMDDGSGHKNVKGIKECYITKN